MSSTRPRLSKAERLEEAKERATSIRVANQRRARRARLIAVAALAVAVATLVTVGTWVVIEGNRTQAANAQVAFGADVTGALAPQWDQVTSPTVADQSGGIAISDDGMGTVGDGDVVVDIYLDLGCPFCGQFEQLNHPALNELITNGGVSVVYHVIAFLDEQWAGSRYSTRAGNALAVVADQDPNHFDAFMSALYLNQPTEGTTGLSDEEIAELASQVGVEPDVVERFTATVNGTVEVAGKDTPAQGTWRTFAPWLAAGTSQAAEDLGKLSTPTILIDGQSFTDWGTPGALTNAVVAAFTS